MYESDITLFLRELMQNDPQLEVLQKQNRATWWDRKPDADQNRRYRESRVAVSGYAYFPLPETPHSAGNKLSSASSPE